VCCSRRRDLWTYRRLASETRAWGLALAAGALSSRAAVEGRCENRASALTGEASNSRSAARAFACRRASLCALATPARQQQHTDLALPWRCARSVGLLWRRSWVCVLIGCLFLAQLEAFGLSGVS
jgi:hypothetical protein